MECYDCGRTYSSSQMHNHTICETCAEPEATPYAIRTAAFKEFLAAEQPRANPEIFTVRRMAFNAGWKARKIAQYKGEIA